MNSTLRVRRDDAVEFSLLLEDRLLREAASIRSLCGTPLSRPSVVGHARLQPADRRILWPESPRKM